MTLHSSVRLGLISALLGLSGMAWGFSTSTEYSSFFVPGGVSESTRTLTYDGAKKHEEVTSRSKYFIVGGSKEGAVEIVRADLGKVWNLDAKHKRYVETDLCPKEEKQPEAKPEPKEERKQPTEKPSEPEYRIKKITTRVTGPGAAVVLHGLQSRPYTVKTEVIWERIKDHQEAGTWMVYDKLWTTKDAGALQQFRKDETAFMQAEAENCAGGKLELKRKIEQWQQIMAQQPPSAKSASKPAPQSEEDWTRIFMEQSRELSKISGTPVRTLMTWIVSEPGTTQEAAAKPSESETKEEESAVQPGDLSGGSVGGMLGNIATRWAAKKATKAVDKKIEQKMAEHPAWVDEIRQDLPGVTIPFAEMTEQWPRDSASADSALFEIPAGYKKVKSL